MHPPVRRKRQHPVRGAGRSAPRLDRRRRRGVLRHQGARALCRSRHPPGRRRQAARSAPGAGSQRRPVRPRRRGGFPAHRPDRHGARAAAGRGRHRAGGQVGRPGRADRHPADLQQHARGRPRAGRQRAAHAHRQGGADPGPAAKAPVASAAPTASANGSYYLQAGAFRGQDDAESLKARIILLGLPVAVQKAEVNGKPINRVRVGPFARLDDMNRARGRLGENKIETAVVRQ
ncbi:SPOR domain-containing protein [Achromobacter xylosoxidans]